MRSKIAVLPLMIVAVLVSGGCEATRRGEAAEPSNSDTSESTAEPLLPVATVTGDRLRARTLPSLDAPVFDLLAVGSKWPVSGVTDRTHTIGEHTAPWYRLKVHSIDVWSYGGFLNVQPGDDPEAIPTIPISDLSQTRTTAQGARVAPPSSTEPKGILPYWVIELDDSIPPLEEWISERIVRAGWNRVITLSGTPRESILVIALSPDGQEFRRSFAVGDTDHDLVVIADELGEELVLLRFTFAPPASTTAGRWRISAVLDGDESNTQEFSQHMHPEMVSMAPVGSTPTPFRLYAGYTVEHGEQFALWVAGRESRSETAVTLYIDTGECCVDGLSVARPLVSFAVPQGPTETPIILSVGDDIPIGVYGLAAPAWNSRPDPFGRLTVYLSDSR